MLVKKIFLVCLLVAITVQENWETIADLDCDFQTVDTACDANNELYRRADGSCNNVNTPYLGQPTTPFARILDAVYDDGLGTIRSVATDGSDLPNTRLISNSLCPSGTQSLDKTRSNMFVMFGQFLTHDLAASLSGTDSNGNALTCSCSVSNDDCIYISIPSGDTIDTSVQTCMTLTRTGAPLSSTCNLSTREQVNTQTHYIDLSQVYGTSTTTQSSLRTLSGGLLTTQTGINSKSYLPSATIGSCKDDTSSQPCFASGDARTNENMGLTSLHTTWLREHNRIAAKLQTLNPTWTDETLFQQARKINIAQYQHIIYNEWLPTLIGSTLVSQYDLSPLTSGFYTGYNSSGSPTIYNEFATAAFRLHSMVKASFTRYNTATSASDSILLSLSSFRSAYAWDSTNGGLSSIAYGSVKEKGNLFDTCMIKTLTSKLALQELFGQPDLTYDLTAINAMRGRDHGLGSYADYVRWATGSSSKFTSFSSLSLISSTSQTLLSGIYKSPEDIDLYVGGISETALTDAATGFTFSTIIAKQFLKLKQADRFFYEISSQPHSFTSAQLNSIRGVTYSRILCNNLDSVSTMQPSAFIINTQTGNTDVSCSAIAELDLTLWKA